MAKKSSLVYFPGTKPTALLQEFADVAALFPVIKPTGYARKLVTKESDRVLSVVLSDLHFGTDLLPEEHLLAYSNKEEARRLAKVLQNVLDYKHDKRDSTTLQILINGDLFAGLLGHDDKAVAELSVQMMRSAHLLCQFISHCAAEFKRVVVRVQYGNHGRNKLRHFSRADNSKWENFELIVMVMVGGPLRQCKNITWDIPKRPVSFWKTFDHRFGMTHGDTVLGKKPGTESLLSALSQVKSSRFYGLKGELDVMFLGHWHQGMMYVVGDTTVFVNPPLLPPDGHSESSGYLNACGQWLVESTAKYAVGDARLVRVGVEDDVNSKLDDLINPWTHSLVFNHVEET